MLGGTVFFFVAALVISLGAHAELNCEDIFQPPRAEPLTEAQVIQVIHNLAIFRMKLDLAQAQSISRPQATSLRLAYAGKENSVVEYLEARGIMTRAELIKRVRDSIIQSQASEARDVLDKQEQKNEQQKDLEEAIGIEKDKARFYTIEPGVFRVPMRSSRSYPVEISKPFEMAATQTTQVVWRKIVQAIQKKYPRTLWHFGWSYVPGRYGALKLNPSKFVGETHPVENVSYNDVQLWLTALNELAADGHPVVKEVILRHTTGGIYRLPTSSEWTFVARGRGAAMTLYSFGNSFKTNYGWSKENSDGTTHPVATKDPFIFEEKEFFDFQGNVFEMTSDAEGFLESRSRDPYLLGDVNSKRVVRGGSYASDPLSINHDEKIKPDSRYSSVGFRLVRSQP